MADERVTRNIVVLGASSGGVEALSRVLGGLPAALPAAVFIVLHTSSSAPALLAKVLGRGCRLPVRMAEQGAPLEHGVVQVAPPDHHLLLTAEHVVLDRGPAQNRVRPAIDALFRSAAVHHGSAVVGVVLSGNLSDGSAGLAAIKRCGGAAIVQAPGDAQYPDMPRNAIAADSPDLVIPLDAIAPAIVQALAEPAAAVSVPVELQLEATPGLQTGAAAGLNDRFGERIALSCPDCGGPLWRLDGRPLRYRCLIGHAYDERVLMVAKSEEALRALEIAVRTLDERAQMMASMAERNHDAARSRAARQYMLRHEELRKAAQTVRQLIDGIANTTGPEPG